MANAMIFYRTPTTTKAMIPNPADLPAGQILEWIPPDDLAKRIQDAYTNNIVRQLPTLPFGRRINQNDEGCAGWTVTIEGDFLGDLGESSSKLHSFRILPQGDDYHVFGCFGILWPNGPSYLQTRDPDDSQGWMIVSANGSHVGLTGKLVDFSLQLSYGGDVE